MSFNDGSKVAYLSLKATGSTKKKLNKSISDHFVLYKRSMVFSVTRLAWVQGGQRLLRY